MRTIVHISDLHFGRVDHALIAPLTAQIVAAEPDLLVVSGDLTQRAKTSEFKAAKKFLETFTMPKIIVPGNHDVPLYNIFKRFTSPLGNYMKYEFSAMLPCYADEEIAIVGLDSTKSLTVQGGHTRSHELAQAAAFFATIPKGVKKVVVIHHPFIAPPSGTRNKKLLGDSRALKAFLDEYDVDIVLSGHLHTSHSGTTEIARTSGHHSVLVVHAGSALSTRQRGETASFNILRSSNKEVTVKQLSWDRDHQEYQQTLTTQFTA